MHSLQNNDDILDSRRAEHPPEIITYPPSQELESGDKVEFVCQVQGYPEPRVEFWLNNKKITSNENFIIGKTYHEILACIKINNIFINRVQRSW